MGAWFYRLRSALAARRPAARAAARRETVQLEGVVILGMHRSGTSLITRLVSLLGLALCREEDLLVGRKANPRGHWESNSMLAFNDRLLEELDASWFCPPPLQVPELQRLLKRHAGEALMRLHDTHREQPWVWKDPRTCALLPFWSTVLEGRAAYVLVLRHPLEVSDSLSRRDGYSPALGLALWERYTRQAMLGAAGQPTLVCTYDGVLADPVGWCERLSAFLGELGMAQPEVDRSLIGAFATRGLRHSHQSWTGLRPGPLLSEEQVALAEIASAFTAQETYVPPALPAETPQTESIFREIRDYRAARRKDGQLPSGLPSHLRNAPARTSDTQVSGPPASVVLVRGGAASLEVVGSSLPDGSEILLVGDGEDLGESSREGLLVRHIDCDPQLSESAALALGTQAATGEIVLLAGAGLLRCQAWYEPFKRALAARRVVAVGPLMRSRSRPERGHVGRAFVDEDLATRLLDGADTQVPVPVPVPAPLLFAAYVAYNAKVLAAAGGLDGGFGSGEAAVAELSVRLWRMGFNCCTTPEVEAWSELALEDRADEDAERLYDRLRLAALHFDAPRLRTFTDRASRLPAYEQAAERLAASDIEYRRAEITAICPFPIARYFELFPPTGRKS
jgi:hypothetical protein